MDEATGEAEGSGLRVAFDRRLKLEFHGASVPSDAGLLAFRELDDALGLTAMAADVLTDPRTGRNGRHSLIAQLRQSVFGRIAGYEDVNDADRLGRDPAMRWSATYGAQEGTAYNGHFACTCYHPLFVFNQDGDLERCALRPGNVHSAHGWRAVLDPGGGAVSWPSPPPTAAWGCSLRPAGRVRVPGSGGVPVRHSSPGQSGALGADRAAA